MKKIKNKKIILILFVMILVVSSFLVAITKKEYSNKKTNSVENDNTVPSYLAINLEESYNSGTYNKSYSDTWPSENEYVYNSEKSYCDDGSLVAYDSFFKQASVTLNGSDKCYLYFDKIEHTSLVDTVKNLAETTASQTKWKVEYVGDGYRYRGSDSQNYVTFNGTTYKIIGVFDKGIDINDDGTVDYHDEVTKLVSLTSYSQSDSTNIYVANGYSEMDAYIDLNDDGSTYSTAYYASLDRKSKNMIVATDFGTGSLDFVNGNADKFYQAEQSLDTVDVKVGLLSPSDFGYSIYTTTSSNACNSSIYYSSSCYSLSYMKINNAILSYGYKDSTYSFYINSYGLRIESTSSTSPTTLYAYPVIYLRPGTYVTGGSGTSTDPYTIDYDYNTNYDYFANTENTAECSVCNNIHNEKGLRFQGKAGTKSVNSYNYVNNIVCIGTDVTTCQDSSLNSDYLYRIIGAIPTEYASDDNSTVTDKKAYLLKVVKNTYYYQDGSAVKVAYMKDGSQADFANSDLEAYLNNTVYNSISQNSLIAKAKWYTGAITVNTTTTINQTYLDERNNKTLLGNDNRYIGFIGTVYATDKAYSVYESEADRDTLGINSNKATTIKSFIPVGISYLMSGDLVNNRQAFTNAYFAATATTTSTNNNQITRYIIPAFYLKPSVTITGGNGTFSDPFIISNT